MQIPKRACAVQVLVLVEKKQKIVFVLGTLKISAIAGMLKIALVVCLMFHCGPFGTKQI